MFLNENGFEAYAEGVIEEDVVEFELQMKDYEEIKKSSNYVQYNTNKSELEIITVENVEELYEAIGSNRKILLETGDYYISELTVENEYIETIYNLTIRDVNNLIIEGIGNEPVNLYMETDGTVMSLKNVHNIEISNLRIGHATEYDSMGGDIFIEDSGNIVINNSILFGRGAWGIYGENVHNMTFINSLISGCQHEALSMNNCSNWNFNNVSFARNGYWEIINIINSEYISFHNLYIFNNLARKEIFRIIASSNIVVKDSIIEDNESTSLKAGDSSIDFENVMIRNNGF